MEIPRRIMDKIQRPQVADGVQPGGMGTVARGIPNPVAGSANPGGMNILGKISEMLAPSRKIDASGKPTPFYQGQVDHLSDRAYAPSGGGTMSDLNKLSARMRLGQLSGQIGEAQQGQETESKKMVGDALNMMHEIFTGDGTAEEKGVQATKILSTVLQSKVDPQSKKDVANIAKQYIKGSTQSGASKGIMTENQAAQILMNVEQGDWSSDSDRALRDKAADTLKIPRDVRKAIEAESDPEKKKGMVASAIESFTGLFDSEEKKTKTKSKTPDFSGDFLELGL